MFGATPMPDGSDGSDPRLNPFLTLNSPFGLCKRLVVWSSLLAASLLFSSQLSRITCWRPFERGGGFGSLSDNDDRPISDGF